MAFSSPFNRWRSMRSERFDLALSRYRHLLEFGDVADGNFAARMSALDKAAIQPDPRREEALKRKIQERSFNAKRTRLETLNRLRELSALDFGMVGGVAPIGSMGGSGDGARPTSMAGRS